MAWNDANTLATILISLGGWATITTVILILARRDVGLGLKKWWMLKRKMQPLKLRYNGPDKNEIESIISMKNQGEIIERYGRKLLIFKDKKNGMTFLLDT